MVPYLRVANVFENRIDLDDVKEMNFNPKEQATYLLKPGDILLNEGQSPHLVGRPALYRGERAPCFFQNTLVRFRAGRGVLPGWALLVFRSQLHSRRYMRFATITTNIAHLGAERFAGVEFPVPPLGLQREIVAQFELQESRLDAAVASLKRAKANLKRARASVLKAAVEGRLVPTEAALAQTEGREYEPASVLLRRILGERKEAWAGSGARGNYSEPVRPDTEGLPALPGGWAWASSEQLAGGEPYALSIGPFGSNLKVPDYREQGVPLVFVRNIRNGHFGDDKCVDVGKAAELRAHQCRPGDVLITKMGDPPGDSWVYPQDRPMAVITSDVVKWTIGPSAGVAWFFAYATRAGAARTQILDRTQGVAQKKISLDRFRSVAYPLPPLAEQYRIVAEVDRRLSVLDALDATVDANLARCTRLRQSILKRAFEGRLVAPGTSVDSPA